MPAYTLKQLLGSSKAPQIVPSQDPAQSNANALGLEIINLIRNNSGIQTILTDSNIVPGRTFNALSKFGSTKIIFDPNLYSSGTGTTLPVYGTTSTSPSGKLEIHLYGVVNNDPVGSQDRSLWLIQFASALLHELGHVEGGLPKTGGSLRAYKNSSINDETDAAFLQLLAKAELLKVINPTIDIYGTEISLESLGSGDNLSRWNALKDQIANIEPFITRLEEEWYASINGATGDTTVKVTLVASAQSVLVPKNVAGLSSQLPSQVLKQSVNEAVGERFVSAVYDSVKQALSQPNFDPLVIDLDGTGFRLTPSSIGKLLPVQNNGFDQATSWISPAGSNGVLFFDPLNSNAFPSLEQIFSEYFVKQDGSHALNGIEALASLDINQDGVIDSSDSAYSKIKIVLSDDSILGLADAGIASINLSATTTSEVDVFGNQKKMIASYTRTDNTEGVLADYLFAYNTALTVESSPLLPESSPIVNLPDSLGYGTVRSLHQAMLRDSSGILEQLVSQFVNSSDPTEQSALVNSILLYWTESQDVNPNDISAHFDGQRLAIVNKFMGQNFVGSDGSAEHVGGFPSGSLGAAYKGLADLLFGQLMLQTHFSDYANLITVEQDTFSDTVTLDLSAASLSILGVFDVNESAGRTLLSDFARSIVGAGLDQISNWRAVYYDFRQLNSEYGWLMDSAGFENVITGSSANERLGSQLIAPVAINGFGGNDIIVNNSFSSGVLYGGDGDDSIYGGYLRDRISGGKGNDYIYLGAGQETIIFELGDGIDVIDGRSSSMITGFATDSGDTLEFGGGINFQDIHFETNGSNLLLKFNNSDDQITIVDGLRNGDPSVKIVQNFVFSDSSQYSLATIIEEYLSTTLASDQTHFVGSRNNITIYGSDQSATIFTGSGDNHVLTGTGNNVIYTGSGSNVVELGSGENTVHSDSGIQSIVFGSGTAQVFAGSTANTFFFNALSGNATITRSGGADYLIFDDDIESDNIEFVIDGGDLKLNFSQSQVTLKGQIFDDGTDSSSGSLKCPPFHRQVFFYETSTRDQ